MWPPLLILYALNQIFMRITLAAICDLKTGGKTAVPGYP